MKQTNKEYTEMEVGTRNYIRFTRSSVIVYRKCADTWRLKDGMIVFGSIMHDVNGSGNLYGRNKTDYKGDYVVLNCIIRNNITYLTFTKRSC